MENDLSERDVRNLHDELGDPFVMVPIRGTLSSLSDALYTTDENFSDSMGVYDRSRKYWPIQCELKDEEIGMIIGNAFVLGQVAITQAVSIFLKLRNKCTTPDRYPNKKTSIMDYKSERILSTNISSVTLIDAMANYFKHHHEWNDDWDESKSIGVQRNTIRTIKSVGLAPGELTINMKKGLSCLENHGDGLEKICDITGKWRETLQSEIAKDPGITN